MEAANIAGWATGHKVSLAHIHAAACEVQCHTGSSDNLVATLAKMACEISMRPENDGLRCWQTLGEQ